MSRTWQGALDRWLKLIHWVGNRSFSFLELNKPSAAFTCRGSFTCRVISWGRHDRLPFSEMSFVKTCHYLVTTVKRLPLQGYVCLLANQKNGLQYNVNLKCVLFEGKFSFVSWAVFHTELHSKFLHSEGHWEWVTWTKDFSVMYK